ncbi:MAG: formyltetrahydrofolate deformylase [Akkermansiaceae bacterium]|nr:formyltetrahydrofolate deformylase [Armatimonadota bacterium]
MKNTAIIRIVCPDRKGIVAAIADFLFEKNGNIVHADQHEDGENGLFFMRVEWDLTDFTLESDPAFRAAFAPLAESFAMRYQLDFTRRKLRVAVFVSKYDHCLADLLYRHRAGEIPCEMAVVIGNHADTKPLADYHDVPFVHIPVPKDDKAGAEARQIAAIEQNGADLIVLARYMQILSPEFVARYPQRIINIHHSFLPAFIGAKPYHRAFERGVKLIGATGHYVTEVLDDGPIIEQDVLRITHRDGLDDLIQKGRDVEKSVLSRAVRWHCEHRIVVNGNKTYVFD